MRTVAAIGLVAVSLLLACDPEWEVERSVATPSEPTQPCIVGVLSGSASYLGHTHEASRTQISILGRTTLPERDNFQFQMGGLGGVVSVERSSGSSSRLVVMIGGIGAADASQTKAAQAALDTLYRKLEASCVGLPPPSGLVQRCRRAAC